MAAVLPPIPDSYKSPSEPSGSLSAPQHLELLPAGLGYLTHLQLTLKNLSFADHDALEASHREKRQSDSPENGDDLGVGDEPESEELLALDPKEWKRQDHYAVLGLSHLRFKANAEQIKIAHRKKVLKHHPDKKVSSVAPSGTSTPATSIYASLTTHTNTNDDAFFKCIQKAHEVLTNPTRRAQFDSIDPHFDPESGPFICQPAASFELLPPPIDLPPPLPKSITDSKKPLDFDTFYKHFAPFYEREARFSRIQPVPLLGAVDATKAEVEGFYDFWYNFDSWRSFEWLDKEVNEGSDSRDDKRYTEKKNKSERARRKKEDVARLRSLVDATLAQDPRIKRIKQEEKEARDAKKKTKGGVPQPTKQDLEAEKKKKEEEEKRKAEEESVARAEAKKAKAAAANAAKKARRAARAAAGADGENA